MKKLVLNVLTSLVFVTKVYFFGIQRTIELRTFSNIWVACGRPARGTSDPEKQVQ